jgi:Putative Ig domain
VLFGFGTPGLSYPVAALSARQGAAIAALAPSLKRTGPASFSVAPALPAGLTLDPATGVISGIPTAPVALAAHTITMTDLAGTVTASIAIEVKDTKAPVISKLELTRKRFAVTGKRRGTTLSFTLSEAAKVKVAIQRKRSGRRKGGKCVAPQRSCARPRSARAT